MKKTSYVMKIFRWMALPGAAVCLSGCKGMLLLDPKGPIGNAERFIIISAFMLMLVVVIPVFVLIFWFSRRYRASNNSAAYSPRWDSSAAIDAVIWLVPLAIVTAMGALAWRATFQLDPYKPIGAGADPGF